MLAAGSSAAIAQNIPGSADAGRIEVVPEEILTPREVLPIIMPDIAAPEVPLPEGAAEIKFNLENVIIEGMSAFTREEMENIYKLFLGQEISVSFIWELAGRITERYRNEGYFLSRAYVPAQKIGNGTIILRVIEGYIGDVRIMTAKENYLVEIFKRQIMDQKPIKLNVLEQQLLLLRDIPGRSFEAVLSHMDDQGPEGALRLILKEEKTSGRGSVLFNNHGSRFSGPHRTSFAYEDSFLSNQSTSISGIASILPVGDELWAISVTHEIRLLPKLGFKFSTGRTISEPGFTLSSNEIESRSMNWSAELEWLPLRQRQKNMSFRFGLDAQNVNTDILGTSLTRDRIRAIRLSGFYEGSDPLHGYNFLNMSVSRGVPGIGANKPGELSLSRAAAKPDFTKFEATWQRSQFIATDWLGISTLSGQRASKALYSSEEFGFGGPSLGRAYDASEITGDHAIGGALEMQYLGLNPIHKLKFTPSIFYEMGKIWNIDDGQHKGLSLADAGIGLNFSYPSGLSGSLSIAQPLTKPIDTPTYGNNGKNPRVFFQIGWKF